MSMRKISVMRAKRLIVKVMMRETVRVGRKAIMIVVVVIPTVIIRLPKLLILIRIMTFFSLLKRELFKTILKFQMKIRKSQRTKI